MGDVSPTEHTLLSMRIRATLTLMLRRIHATKYVLATSRTLQGIHYALRYALFEVRATRRTIRRYALRDALFEGTRYETHEYTKQVRSARYQVHAKYCTILNMLRRIRYSQKDCQQSEVSF